MSEGLVVSELIVLCWGYDSRWNEIQRRRVCKYFTGVYGCCPEEGENSSDISHGFTDRHRDISDLIDAVYKNLDVQLP